MFRGYSLPRASSNGGFLYLVNIRESMCNAHDVLRFRSLAVHFNVAACRKYPKHQSAAIERPYGLGRRTSEPFAEVAPRIGTWFTPGFLVVSGYF